MACIGVMLTCSVKVSSLFEMADRLYGNPVIQITVIKERNVDLKLTCAVLQHVDPLLCLVFLIVIRLFFVLIKLCCIKKIETLFVDFSEGAIARPGH
jgi:hypothetical protein